MNPNRMHDDTDRVADYERTTLAAVFPSRDAAHDAVHRLHEEGFRDTWVGLTRSDNASVYGSTSTSESDTRVEADNWFTRFFGEGDESLHDALVRHGVAESDAAGAGSLPANSAIVTVDGANHPELAAQLISETGGRLITSGFGTTGYGTTGAYASQTDTYGSLGTTESAGTGYQPAGAGYADATLMDSTGMAAGSTASGMRNAPYDAADDLEPIGGVGMTAGSDTGYGSYRRGEQIDQDTRIRLREERLRVDTERRSRGEATVGKEVVTQTHDIDVPLIREELFIERRPVSGDAAATMDATPIGSDTEVVRIPLTEETVSVTKVPVVTEEVVIGKRAVESTEHVSETTRKEQLNVRDVDTIDRPATSRN